MMRKITQGPPDPALPPEGIQNLKHFFAVASGKGGVGKTTVAINLALTLAKRGYRAGLLEADIYGPSISTMLDPHEIPEEKCAGYLEFLALLANEHY